MLLLVVALEEESEHLNVEGEDVVDGVATAAATAR